MGNCDPNQLVLGLRPAALISRRFLATCDEAIEDCVSCRPMETRLFFDGLAPSSAIVISTNQKIPEALLYGSCVFGKRLAVESYVLA
jgi:hypothetical protein